MYIRIIIHMCIYVYIHKTYAYIHVCAQALVGFLLNGLLLGLVTPNPNLNPDPTPDPDPNPNANPSRNPNPA